MRLHELHSLVNKSIIPCQTIQLDFFDYTKLSGVLVAPQVTGIERRTLSLSSFIITLLTLASFHISFPISPDCLIPV